jgi:hypothetical protein
MAAPADVYQQPLNEPMSACRWLESDGNRLAAAGPKRTAAFLIFLKGREEVGRL